MTMKSPSRPARREPARRNPATGALRTGEGVTRTLGPVADLERHLPSEWWRGLFNSVYLKTDGDIVENDAATRIEVDRVLDAARLPHGARILDLCCGQGRHTLELARRGFLGVSGLDRSRYLIRLARRRAREQGLPIRFHEGDARKISPRFKDLDAVLLLGNSFGYFDREEDDLAVLTAIREALVSEGRLVLDLTDGAWMKTGYEPRSWEWIDQDQFVCRERSLTADGKRLVSREVVVHAEKGVLADQFYAERLYDVDAIQTLLDRAGFGDIVVHGEQTGVSSRGTDLGMMARRLLVTARGPSRVARPAADPLRVTVLLGDSRLPDAIKRDGVFNPEDQDAVERLKHELALVPGIAATFLDRHDTLLLDLAGSRQDLVFNLCDEGFRNDALMELHVPAYLEMLGVAYTGSGPATLALCYDKSAVRSIAETLDIPVPMESFVRVDDTGATLPSIFPAFIKPAQGDSSIGITARSVVHTPAELVAALSEARREWPDRPFLVQEFLTGPEYSVGLVGNAGAGLRALPILEVDYSELPEDLPKILGYESKWLPDSPYWTNIRYVQARVDDEQARRIVDWSQVLFERLGCRDYARFDFRADASGEIKLLEVNPNPGWTWDAKLNLMAAMDGMTYGELLTEIIEAASRRLGVTGRLRLAA
jgi:D-alanine-D-alanine ligase